MQEPKKSDEIIYGIRPVIEAINQKTEINKILVQKGLSGPVFHELRALLKGSLVNIQLVPVEKLNKVTKNNHQGVVAYISPVVYYSIEKLIPKLLEEKKAPKLLVLDHITDVRNFGSIARTAECTGFDAIIIPSTGSAMVTGDAMKTSAGALHKIKVCKVDNLRKALDFISDSEISIYACTEKTDTLISDCDFKGPIAIVMGAEDKGISLDLINRSHYICKIPMQGDIQSMNVAVAAGIIMYEVNRK
jgi:23S rRNA (guanosine2251-2'-O)-methyltransferase